MFNFFKKQKKEVAVIVPKRELITIKYGQYKYVADLELLKVALKNNLKGLMIDYQHYDFDLLFNYAGKTRFLAKRI